MDEKKFIAFLFRVLLEEHFRTKTAMAKALKLPLRTLRINYQNLDRSKGGTVAFERLIVYCLDNDIDIVILYNRHIGECADKKRGDILREHGFRGLLCDDLYSEWNVFSLYSVLIRSLKSRLVTVFSLGCSRCTWQRDLYAPRGMCPI